jgi:ABC-2 type transport system permease protein
LNGFYGILVPFYALILAIAAVMWGSTVISKEERDRTVEFSLTLPVTRARVITAKALAAFVDCVVLLVVMCGFTMVGAQKYAPDAVFYKFVAISALAFFIIEMIFLALGIFLGCVMKKYKQSGGLAIAILLTTYFASVITTLSKNLDFLKYVSPFKYFDPLLMLHESRLEVLYVLLSVGIIVVFMVGAYFTYKKRDLYI